MLWKGRLGFRQYIPSKRHRYGIKAFVLCDCQTGYILDIIPYTGKDTALDRHADVGVSGSVVLTMLGPYKGRGHIVYLDNWYSSPLLFSNLHALKIGACGTVRSNRKHLPTFPKLKKGEVKSYHANNVLALKWNDRKDVTLLTTVHNDEIVTTEKERDGQPQLKPKAIIDYNKNMRLVDKSDMMISFNECLRKTRKWYKKYFFHLMDLCVLNAYYIHCSLTGKKPGLRVFS
ncbi:piggyBac transposable element-derived protein 4-like [Penaeus japonicus]|nr:piggyBac transposable element-derived protein 4-like [Penaeus japonicus]